MTKEKKKEKEKKQKKTKWIAIGIFTLACIILVILDFRWQHNWRIVEPNTIEDNLHVLEYDAELRYTWEAVSAAIWDRVRRCDYAGNVWSYEVRPESRTIKIYYIANEMQERNFEENFRRYVYDSPLIEIDGVWFFSLGRPPLSPYRGYLGLLLSIVGASAAVVLIYRAVAMRRKDEGMESKHVMTMHMMQQDETLFVSELRKESEKRAIED